MGVGVGVAGVLVGVGVGKIHVPAINPGGVGKLFGSPRHPVRGATNALLLLNGAVATMYGN